MRRQLTLIVVASILAACAASARADDAPWINLLDNPALAAWQEENDGWIVAGDAALDPSDPQSLVSKPGQGVVISILQGRANFRNLTSKQTFGDLEAHIEFLLPQRGNAGVKFLGLYEIQLLDSYGKQQLTGDACGGVYPRAELRPRYHLLDKGIPPRINAAKPPGQWQTLDVVFQAPRFDADGKKTAHARFLKVVLNGQLVQENAELKWPTGHAWRKEKEVPRGPLFLQGDHGPVAYRNVRVRAID